MRPSPTLPDEIEDLRDLLWRREGARQVTSAQAAEQFVEQVGFAASLTDARRPGPSLYVAVCGRRDAVMPRNVQTDHEASLTWQLKDDELYQFYVAAPARGTGVAAALMHDAEQRLVERGVSTAWLACAIGNARAARFYEKCGWRLAATVTSPLDTPAGIFPLDVWRYEKRLR